MSAENVFLFLSLLVAVLALGAKVIPRFDHLLPDDAPKARKSSGSSSAKKGLATDEGAVIAAAIAAAVARSRG